MACAYDVVCYRDNDLLWSMFFLYIYLYIHMCVSKLYQYLSIHVGTQIGLVAHKLFAFEVRSDVDGLAPFSCARPVVLVGVIWVRLAGDVMGKIVVMAVPSSLISSSP